MKRKVLFGALAWALFVTAWHVQLNIGWRELARELRALGGEPRQELIVGFLPVT